MDLNQLVGPANRLPSQLMVEVVVQPVEYQGMLVQLDIQEVTPQPVQFLLQALLMADTLVQQLLDHLLIFIEALVEQVQTLATCQISRRQVEVGSKVT
jgi:hypothetical protein